MLFCDISAQIGFMEPFFNAAMLFFNILYLAWINLNISEKVFHVDGNFHTFQSSFCYSESYGAPKIF